MLNSSLENIERWAKTDGAVAGADKNEALVVAFLLEEISHLGFGKIEGAHQPAASCFKYNVGIPSAAFPLQQVRTRLAFGNFPPCVLLR